ncbi:hypothetical protein A3J56_00490 [Candidatus Giovannonibacteria bacterium RIFCSPHIGHO2_02_FULL_46_20]|uniref:Uncharacterized protein n=1 Tax=Candidatus Giovannonibacteria bacterium RIFCSPHIGHO2_02_FULL_46_20 TaxID=1798338 RepID=A0A1F5WFN5_9BACT|nr:MAG: hypothetical protein A3J56_00490 [Candidatus Giovannonibacteria bacterium RIFCSPHIGHO2_02_FULL_46_20]
MAQFFVEETVIAEQEVGEEKPDIFYRAAQWCLLILAALLPVWFLPTTTSPVILNKVFFVSILTMVAALCYLAHAILRGRATIPFHYAWIAFLAALLVWVVSALLSPQVITSFFGVGGEVTTVSALVVFGVLAFMISALFGTPKDYARLMVALGIGFALFLLSVLFFALGGGRLLGGIFTDESFNTIGSWRSVALVLGFYVLLAYPFLLRATGRVRSVLAALFIAGLLGLIVVNVPITWGIVGFFAIMFLSYAIWQRVISGALLVVSLLLLVISLFGFFSQDIISAATPVVAPLEVNISHQATLGLLKSALGENLLLGHGPATFVYLWDRLKPLEINQLPFWNTRFAVGSSLLLTIPTEVGVLGALAFLTFLALVWLASLRAAMMNNEQWLFGLSAFVVLSYIMLVWALYPVGYTLVALGFIAIGFGLAVLRVTGLAPTYELVLFREGPSGFIASLFLVFLMILGAGGVYLSSTRYAGQVAFARGLDMFNREGNIESAETILQSAIRFDSRNSAYARSLSQLYVVRARNVAQANAAPRELLGSQFADVLDRAIRAGQDAIRASSLDFENYQSLGKVYEFLIPLGAEGAMQAAVTQYEEGLKRAPKNPSLFRDQALAYFAEAVRTNNTALLGKAETALQKSLELKPNYTDAHFLLAQIYDSEGNAPEAIRRSEAAALLAPNDIGALFQLGLLYYKANRLPDAEVVLKRAVANNTNYSNARYFLGLMYDRTNRRTEAIEEFEKIAALNPGNSEVQAILSNLRAGRPALSSIVPPPEERKSPPVDEN